ncbi:MAG: hypothetical protein AAGI70_12175 [Pseudomonadota bacterium]
MDRKRRNLILGGMATAGGLAFAGPRLYHNLTWDREAALYAEAERVYALILPLVGSIAGAEAVADFAGQFVIRHQHLVGSPEVLSPAVSAFLLSTDYFDEARAPDAPVSYYGYMDPLTAPCANPLARFDAPHL